MMWNAEVGPAGALRPKDEDRSFILPYNVAQEVKFASLMRVVFGCVYGMLTEAAAGPQLRCPAH